MKQKVYTSLYLPVKLKSQLYACSEKLNVDLCDLLSILCFKASNFVSTKTQVFQTVEYQERGEDYEITPVYFFAADHEFMHSNRLARKVSVSKLLSCAMAMFLDEIMEKGINQMEIVRLRVIENSYKQKTYIIRNCTISTNKNVHFEKYNMRMRIKKRKT